ncbi:MAG: tetratricopeptide repeat protein [Myxococcota bacterium]
MSCYRLGSAYEHGIGIEKDHTWATTAYGTACGAGEAFACYRQGELLLSGALERKNAEGIAALKRGCDGGVGAACASLGRRVQHGEGVEQDASVAAALYHSGCIKGELGACVSAGLLYRDGGEGLARNGEKAVYALELACDEHLAAACGYLGEILLKGWGVSKDTARGRELREQACMWGDHSACLPE